jgi:hypothetical protein
MSDVTAHEETTARTVSRRRFIAGTGAATAAVWAAPTITGLGPSALAQGGSPCPPEFQDSIQSEQGRGPIPTGSVVGGLTIVAGNIDVVGGSFVPELVPSGYQRAIDLDGSASTSTTLRTPSVPAGSYKVFVTLAGDRRNNNNNSVTVTMAIGGLADTQVLTSSQGPTTFDYDVTLAAPDALTIEHNSGAPDFRGMLLLAVVITPTDCTA